MMKRRTLINSILLHALLLLAVYVFQGMIFPYIRLIGLVPLLLPIAGTGIAVYEGRFAGGVFGIFAGIFCDVSFHEPAGLFTVLLTFTGLLIGTMADTVITRRFATYFIACFLVLAVSAFVQMFPLLVFEEVPLRPLITMAVWQTVYSLVFAVPIWFFVNALGKRAQRIAPSGRPL
jgi:cell shape-determining protein MreD